jgi:phosphoglycolate phosphatase
MRDKKFDLLIFDWEGTLFNSNLNQDSKLFTGVELGIKDLKRQGYILSIATGKSREGLNRNLIDANLNNQFLITKTVDECFSKPHPQMILDIINHTMIDSERALMVGDTGYDLQMANNAGIASLAVSYGSQSLEQLKEFNPLAIIESTYDLFDWIRING